MDDQFLAAMMAFSIPAIFVIALAVDTNPISGRRFKTLGARLFDWLCKVIPS